MAISPALTFICEFEVHRSIRGWIGVGNGKSDFGPGEGLVGWEPRFKVRAGWITLFPSKWWIRLLPICALHGIKRYLPHKFARNHYSLGTFSLLVGEALERSLCSGDKLRVSRDAGAGLSYTVTRNSDKILSAGAVGGLDRGGPIAILAGLG